MKRISLFFLLILLLTFANPLAAQDNSDSSVRKELLEREISVDFEGQRSLKKALDYVDDQLDAAIKISDGVEEDQNTVMLMGKSEPAGVVLHLLLKSHHLGGKLSNGTVIVGSTDQLGLPERLLPESPPTTEELKNRLKNRDVSIDFRDRPTAVALKFIHHITNVNILVSRNITQNKKKYEVTLSERNTNALDTTTSILQKNDLLWHNEYGVMWVETREERNRREIGIFSGDGPVLSELQEKLEGDSEKSARKLVKELENNRVKSVLLKFLDARDRLVKTLDEKSTEEFFRAYRSSSLSGTGEKVGIVPELDQLLVTLVEPLRKNDNLRSKISREISRLGAKQYRKRKKATEFLKDVLLLAAPLLREEKSTGPAEKKKRILELLKPLQKKAGKGEEEE